MILGLQGKQVLVSPATVYRMGGGGRDNPLWQTQRRARACVLSVREQGAKAPIGGTRFLAFIMNPKSISVERAAKVGVQQTRSGYVITEGGLAEPRFTLAGSFGWMLQSVIIPPSFYSKGSTPNSQLKTQRYDGQQGWHRLRNLVQWYLDENQRRVAAGEKLCELVWSDPLHGSDGKEGLRWVVTPAYLPSLKRNAETQGIMPYTLELIGHYDDTAPAGAAPSTPSLRPTHVTVAPEKAAKSEKPAARPATGAARVTPPKATQSASSAAAPRSAYDFRFGAFATNFAVSFLSYGPIPYKAADHVPGRDSYMAGVRKLLAKVPDLAQWHGDAAKKQDKASAPSTALNEQYKRLFMQHVAPYALKNLDAGLTPWGDRRIPFTAPVAPGVSGASGGSGAGGGTAPLPTGGSGAGGSSGAGGGSESERRQEAAASFFGFGIRQTPLRPAMPFPNPNPRLLGDPLAPLGPHR